MRIRIIEQRNTEVEVCGFAVEDSNEAALIEAHKVWTRPNQTSTWDVWLDSDTKSSVYSNATVAHRLPDYTKGCHYSIKPI